MTSRTPHRGGATVGYICELDPVEAGAVIYLRMWNGGPDAQSQVWNDFATALGPQGGREALKSFEALCDLCVQHARRPLMRHNVMCKCLGADEASFATFIWYASQGAREDAMLIAMTMVRPEVAGIVTGLAQDFGLALKRMSLNAQRPAHPQLNQTIH